jgi:hypothetical protein
MSVEEKLNKAQGKSIAKLETKIKTDAIHMEALFHRIRMYLWRPYFTESDWC